MKRSDSTEQSHAQRSKSVSGARAAVQGHWSPKPLVDIVDGLGTEFPNARVVELPGGHAMLIVALERFLEIVDEFISEAG